MKKTTHTKVGWIVVFGLFIVGYLLGDYLLIYSALNVVGPLWLTYHFYRYDPSYDPRPSSTSLDNPSSKFLTLLIVFSVILGAAWKHKSEEMSKNDKVFRLCHRLELPASSREICTASGAYGDSADYPNGEK